MHRIVLILFLHYSRVDITFALWGGDDVLSQLVEVSDTFQRSKGVIRGGLEICFVIYSPFFWKFRAISASTCFVCLPARFMIQGGY